MTNSKQSLSVEECAHEWIIPRFGAEDERECRRCRVSAEEVTRAEDAIRSHSPLEDNSNG